MSTALLEVKVIELLQLSAFRRQRFYDRSLRIVNQKHYVGQLDGRILPDPHPGRDAGENGALGGPDQRAGTRGKIVLLQIHHTNQSTADFSVGLGALNVDEGLRQSLKNSLIQILLHGGVDALDVAVHIRIIQPRLRQNQSQRGWRVSHCLLHCLPILRLGGELVAGYHSPAGHVRILRQQDIGGVEPQGLKFFVHIASPFPYFFRISPMVITMI